MLGFRPARCNTIWSQNELKPHRLKTEQYRVSRRQVCLSPTRPSERPRRERLGVAAFDPTSQARGDCQRRACREAAGHLRRLSPQAHPDRRAAGNPAHAVGDLGPAAALETDLVKIGTKKIAARRPKFYQRFQEDKSLKLPGF